MKKHLIVISLFILCFTYKAVGQPAQIPNISNSDTLPAQKYHYNLMVGTLFGKMGNMHSFGTYLAPQVSYQHSPKWSFSGGVLIFNNSISGNFMQADYSMMPQSLQTLSIFGSAHYHVNEKLTFSGTIIKELFPAKNPLSDPMINFNKNMIHMGVDYRLTDNITIGAHFQYREANYNPWLSDYNSPYSPFNPFY